MRKLFQVIGMGLGVLGLGALNFQGPDVGSITSGVRIPVRGMRANTNGFGWESTNWSGYALSSRTSGNFGTISGWWQVPRVHAGTASSSFGANWIGIDGFNNSHLIQTGTGEQVINGVAQYFAWWEILPNAATPINMAVSPGNTMRASIKNLGNGQWQLTIQNVSLHETYTINQTYSGPGMSAEWIEEAPTINGQVTTLDPYSTYSFTNLMVNGQNPFLQPINGGIMVQNHRQVSTPSYPGENGNNFAMAYGSQIPLAPSLSMPHIQYVFPFYSAPGQVIHIFGTNFGSASGQVNVAGSMAQIESWSPNVITVKIPQVSPGTQLLTVTTNSGLMASHQVNILKPSLPTITAAYPNPALPNSVVRLTGRNFGRQQGTVKLQNMPVHIDAWSPYMVVFTVPASASPGLSPLTLTTNQGNTVTDSRFSVAQAPSPSIYGVYPNAGETGQVVRIYGANFGFSKSSVTVGGVSAPILGWSPNMITIVVPSVTSGPDPLVITTSAGSRAEDPSFRVDNISRPSIHPIFSHSSK